VLVRALAIWWGKGPWQLQLTPNLVDCLSGFYPPSSGSGAQLAVFLRHIHIPYLCNPTT